MFCHALFLTRVTRSQSLPFLFVVQDLPEVEFEFQLELSSAKLFALAKAELSNG